MRLLPRVEDRLERPERTAGAGQEAFRRYRLRVLPEPRSTGRRTAWALQGGALYARVLAVDTLWHCNVGTPLRWEFHCGENSTRFTRGFTPALLDG